MTHLVTSTASSATFGNNVSATTAHTRFFNKGSVVQLAFGMIPSTVFVRQLCVMARNQSVLQLADLCKVIRNFN